MYLFFVEVYFNYLLVRKPSPYILPATISDRAFPVDADPTRHMCTLCVCFSKVPLQAFLPMTFTATFVVPGQ